MNNKSNSNSFLPYFIWFLGAIFFFFDYIIRVSPSILTPAFIDFFHTNAFTIGGFSAFFYYAYIGMQIPVGILVDRFGPKWLLIMAAVLCAFSTYLFAEMNNLVIGFFSRFLMGFSASFAFVGTLKLISIWFESKRFAFLAGFTQALGMVGAMVGQGPMAHVYESIGWRSSMQGLAAIFLIIAILMFFFIKDNQHSTVHTQSDQQIHIKDSMKLVLTNPQNWYNCLFIGLLYAPSACFGEQWGASFLSLNQGISIGDAGQQTGLMFIGLAIGCPILGWISDRLQRRLLIMRISVVMCLILLSIVIYGKLIPGLSGLSPSAYTAILFVYGFFNSGIVCSYALASEINPHKLTGMALGITNMASVIIGAIMIPVVGFILDLFSHTSPGNQSPIFDIQGYQIAFAALPIGFILAFAISFLQKETWCRRLSELNDH